MKSFPPLRLLLLLALAIVLTSATSCTPDDPEPPIVDFRLNDAYGTSWTYATTSNTQFATHAVATSTSTLIVAAGTTTLPNGHTALMYRKEDIYGEGPVVVNEAYYHNTSDGFYELGYTLGDHRIAFKTEAAQLRLNGTTFANRAELLATLAGQTPATNKTAEVMVLNNGPQPVLVYNSFERDQWAASLNPNGSVRVSKIVVNRETLSTPAGSLNCAKIQLRYDLDADGNWDPNVEGFQWFGPEGLVRSVFRADGVIAFDPVSGLEQPATLHEVTDLVSWAPPRQVTAPAVNND